MYTGFEQETFNAYCQAERSIALSKYGLTEDKLTGEQDTALTRYMRISQAIYLAKWGPLGPQGNVLCYETQAETAARIEWQNSLKTDEQLRDERLRRTILDYHQIFTNDLQYVAFDYIGEEDSDQELARWRKSGYLAETASLYYVRITDGTDKENTIIEYWLSVDQDDTIEILQIRCVAVHVEWSSYIPTNRPAAVIAEMREWYA